MVSGKNDKYILQKVNTNVFKAPELIAKNVALVQSYLKGAHPDYFFGGMLPATNGKMFVKDLDGDYYRLFPFIEDSKTFDFVSEPKQAFEAARQFGQLTFLLKDLKPDILGYTLPNFHDLKLRFNQFRTAYQNAGNERLDKAENEIKEVYFHYDILQAYNQLKDNNEIPLRIIHHDAKINNALFDDNLNALCVIDLDTIMPGYFFSDVGDMMRTYLSPANEEETDFTKITIRQEVFSAICEGYLAAMGSILTAKEKENFVFAGKIMIYMQAIRFLTDYLNNDAYYGSKYAGHNLIRAKNQFKLLNEYVQAEETLSNLYHRSLKGLNL